MPKVGILHSGTEGKHNPHIDALGLKPGDIVGGKPLYADDDPTKLDTYANNLLSKKPIVLVAAGGTACSNKLQEVTKNAQADPTKRIPVVFTSRADTSGLEQNVSGICARTSESDPDRLELLNELLPDEATVGVLYNKLRSIQPVIDKAGPTELDLNLVPWPVTTAADIDLGFQDFSGKVDGVLVAADPLFNDNRAQVIAGVDSLKKPAIYQWREFVDDDGLISYGTNLTLAYKLAGMYVRSIMAGGTLPQPLKLASFELVINLVTATNHNIFIPPKLLAQANDVIV